MSDTLLVCRLLGKRLCEIANMLYRPHDKLKEALIKLVGCW